MYDSDDRLNIFSKYIVTSKFIQCCHDFFQPEIKARAKKVTIAYNIQQIDL